MNLSQVTDAALLKVGITNRAASQLTKTAMLRNVTIAEKLGSLDASGMDEMRNGKAATVRRGLIILVFKVGSYASGLDADAPWPTFNFKTLCLGIVWAAFPFISGFVSRTCDPHHRLIAIFEGASVPALLLQVATHFSL